MRDRIVPALLVSLGLALVVAGVLPAASAAHDKPAAARAADDATARAADDTGTTLPLGDGKLSSAPKRGYVWSCQPGNPNAPGANGSAPWISGNRWDPSAKPHVAGKVHWPTASYTVKVHGSKRILIGNQLPVKHATGTFPIQSSDPAHQYDGNPNSIQSATIRIAVPHHPKRASSSSCLGFGTIGVLKDGSMLYDALDAQGRDAAAHEVLDRCDGHPQQQGVYHHHTIPSCILNKATGRSTLVGYALDGFAIYVERNADGSLLTNADLDRCHGRTSTVRFNGKRQRIYHYDATAAYPYTLGCYRGTP